LGNRERCEDWLEHFRDLVHRGLKTPLTVTTDGAPGLVKAVEARWPETERSRC
jgi:transposase-like protein